MVVVPAGISLTFMFFNIIRVIWKGIAEEACIRADIIQTVFNIVIVIDGNDILIIWKVI